MMHDAPNLSVKHLRAIVALARFGSFIAAASFLRISQPGLSRIIQQAEEMLGVALFTRGTRSVQQTAAGSEFVQIAERLLNELQLQAQRMKVLDGELRGQLIIAGLMSVCHHVLPSALVAFRIRHPKMHIQIREGVGSSVHDDVMRGIADFGIGNVSGLHEGIVVESVSQESCCVVMPAEHRLKERQAIALKDLVDEPMISIPANSGLRRTVDFAAGEHGVTLNYMIVTGQYPALFEFIRNGLGVAIVPVSALPPLGETRWMAVRPLRPAIKRQIGIIHLSERPLSAASQAFLDIFRPKFQEAVAGARLSSLGGRMTSSRKRKP